MARPRLQSLGQDAPPSSSPNQVPSVLVVCYNVRALLDTSTVSFYLLCFSLRIILLHSCIVAAYHILVQNTAHHLSSTPFILLAVFGPMVHIVSI